MKNLGQKGFGVLETLIVILIVVVIAGAGVVVWGNRQQQADQQTAASNRSEKPKSEVANTTKTDDTKPATVATATELSIPEFGVKISLTSNTKDAYYSMRSGNPAIADLSTHALTTLDPRCAPAASSTAAVSYFTDPNQKDMGDYTMAQLYPDAVKVGEKYFYIALSNGSCSGNMNAVNLQLKLRSDFGHATIEKL